MEGTNAYVIYLTVERKAAKPGQLETRVNGWIGYTAPAPQHGNTPTFHPLILPALQGHGGALLVLKATVNIDKEPGVGVSPSHHGIPHHRVEKPGPHPWAPAGPRLKASEG